MQLMKQTKIVATIGPSSRGRNLAKLLDAGVNVVRLNFSHGTYGEMRQIVSDVRRYSKRTGRPIGIIQDLQGPKVRVGSMADGTALRDGSEVTLTTRNVLGNSATIPLDYKGLPRDVKAGDTVLLDDGLIELEVLRASQTEITATVIHGGPLQSHKGINVPSASVSLPAVTAKDAKDLAFGLELGVDFVALSFVKTAADVHGLRRRIARQTGSPRKTRGSRASTRVPKIISKIEKHEAVTNFAAILEASDAVMVARGDLGVELKPEEVPLIQKSIIHQANRAYKPVITATQMLESMTTHARATRAEVSDIANAILDGTDAVMLSAETATGAFPVEAVTTMAHTAANTEAFFTGRRPRGLNPEVFDSHRTTAAVSMAACELANDINAKLMVIPTASGWSARAVARHRLQKPVVALTEDAAVARELTLSWGVQPYAVPGYRSVDEMIRLARRFVLRGKLAAKGERVVMTAGLRLHQSGKTSMLQVVTL